MCIRDSISVDQNAYAEKYGALAEKYADCKERLDAINEEISRRNVRKSQIAFFLDELAKSKELVTEFSTGLWTVSYTHLDVYKRQGKNATTPSARPRWRRQRPRSGPRTWKKAFLSLPVSYPGRSRARPPYRLAPQFNHHSAKAVSYTHLDVYKRQGQGCRSQSACAGAAP